LQQLLAHLDTQQEQQKSQNNNNNIPFNLNPSQPWVACFNSMSPEQRAPNQAAPGKHVHTYAVCPMLLL
jgi:hypothetical protein